MLRLMRAPSSPFAGEKRNPRPRAFSEFRRTGKAEGQASIQWSGMQAPKRKQPNCELFPARPRTRGRFRLPQHTLCQALCPQAGLLTLDALHPSSRPDYIGTVTHWLQGKKSITAARPCRILTDFPTPKCFHTSAGSSPPVGKMQGNTRPQFFKRRNEKSELILYPPVSRHIHVPFTMDAESCLM